MKISYDWLKEYIDFKQSPKEIAKLLTMSGSEVKSIEKLNGDNIMDLEITPNRNDCLSYIGIAREVSASTGKTIKMPQLKVGKQKSSGKTPFAVDIKDRDLCPRYTARLIRDVKVGESPDWLKKKVGAMGLRPVNSVVDITNYVLFELGQPMHAFDYDKIKGKAIIVRRGREGEKIISIDKVERRLEKDMLIIADKERPVAIGGVMGGLDTEVTEDAKDILLESAYFNPVSVRRASFKLSLMSESSYRFERGVDPEMVLAASDRAALLIKDICGGRICSLIDEGKKSGQKKTIPLKIQWLNRILNLNLKEAYVKKVLNSLFLETSSSKKGVIKVTMPSFRQDIKGAIDLVEEVSRIYGYDKIATTIPKIVPNPERKSLPWKTREKAIEVLTSLGLNEVITYAMAGRGNIQRVFGFDAPETIAVKNYLSSDQEIMRPSLIPGVLNVLGYNINRGVRDLKIFEIGKVYGKDYHYEKTNMCIALTGLSSGDWQRPKGSVTFFDLKGTLERIFRDLGLKDFTMAEEPVPLLGKGTSSRIYYDETCIGVAGRLAANIEEALDLSQKVFLAEIDFDALVSAVDLKKRFIGIPKFPSVKRDISLVVGGDVSFEKITSLVKEQGGELVEKVELFDKYTGKQIPPGHYGLSFRIEYRDKNKTLSAGEVERVHSAIRESLVNKVGVKLR